MGADTGTPTESCGPGDSRQPLIGSLGIQKKNAASGFTERGVLVVQAKPILERGWLRSRFRNRFRSRSRSRSRLWLRSDLATLTTTTSSTTTTTFAARAFSAFTTTWLRIHTIATTRTASTLSTASTATTTISVTTLLASTHLITGDDSIAIAIEATTDAFWQTFHLFLVDHSITVGIEALESTATTRFIAIALTWRRRTTFGTRTTTATEHALQFLRR